MNAPDVHRAIADALAEHGFAMTPHFLPRAHVQALAAGAHAAWSAGRFHRAGIGSGRAFALREDVRGDHIAWLELPGATTEEQLALAHFERLRLTLNRELQLGLFDFESHLARYPAGARYRRHLDRFAGDWRRTLSCVLYLNPHWSEDDGGQLRLYQSDGSRIDVLPIAGVLVTFLSERFEHEVLPARRERLSLAGWFRRRA